MSNQLVFYSRVSTDEQGKSGLGLEGQLSALHNYADTSKSIVIKSFQDIASGKSRDGRPELANAIKLCKKFNYFLVVSKLDRLSRKTVDTLTIFEELKNKVIALDNPNLDSLKLGIMATISQNEREAISQRTKAALDAKYAKDGESWHDTHENVDTDALAAKGREKRTQIAVDANKAAFEIIKPLREQDKPLSFQKIADLLNAKKIQTSKGAYFNASQVRRVYDRGIIASS